MSTAVLKMRPSGSASAKDPAWTQVDAAAARERMRSITGDERGAATSRATVRLKAPGTHNSGRTTMSASGSASASMPRTRSMRASGVSRASEATCRRATRLTRERLRRLPVRR